MTPNMVTTPAMAPAMPIIELAGLTKVFGKGDALVRALRGVDLRIHRGEFVALMGPSGSGKSTFMNIVGCLDEPSSGTFRFEGIDIGKLNKDQLALLRRHYLGFVFQVASAFHRVRSGCKKEWRAYSTVTDFARLRGWSTSVPRSTATW